MSDQFDLHRYSQKHNYIANKSCGVRGAQKGGKIKIPPINKGICAPGSEGSGGICYSKAHLVEMVKSYNETHGDRISVNGTKEQLWARISEKMADQCSSREDKQICVLEQRFAKEHGLERIKKEAFKPERPISQWAWLTTTDILHVLKQYEVAHDDFVFLGTVPIDFCNISPNTGVCGVDLKKAWNNGKYKIGAVFNTDPSHKSGQHWISMYIDLKAKEINYYDSFGKVPIPTEITQFIKILQKQASTIPGGRFTTKINTCRHQQNNSECGVYSINFIVERLSGKSWEEVMDDRLLDDQVNKRRKFYFRPPAGHKK